MKIPTPDRKSTRLNSSHANICPLSLHDALAICQRLFHSRAGNQTGRKGGSAVLPLVHITQQHENTHTARPLLPTAADAKTLPAIPLHPADVENKLTPYEAAAKAIFVKSNGLSAY